MSIRYSVERLDPTKHIREGFDCGIEILNHYLLTRANQEQRKWLNVTYALIEKNTKTKNLILGFYTLSNSALKQSLDTLPFSKNIPASYDIPTIKIGRLAINSTAQKSGLGGFLLSDALNRITEVSRLSGIRGIEVVAKNQHAINFYKKYGFILLSNIHNLLFMPIQTLLKAKNVFEDAVV